MSFQVRVKLRDLKTKAISLYFVVDDVGCRRGCGYDAFDAAGTSVQSADGGHGVVCAEKYDEHALGGGGRDNCDDTM